MILRPRYSLLTLLVLMALVAGGVKLWRGPHDMLLIASSEFPSKTTTSTPEEQQLLQQMPICGSVNTNETLEYRLRYTQGFEDKNFDTGKGTFQNPTYLSVATATAPWNSSGDIEVYIFPRQYLAQEHILRYSNEQDFLEQIACFIFDLKVVPGEPAFFGPFWIKIPLFQGEGNPQPLFFITTNKRIFQVDYHLGKQPVRLVTVAQIAEP